MPNTNKEIEKLVDLIFAMGMMAQMHMTEKQNKNFGKISMRALKTISKIEELLEDNQ